MTSKKMTHLEDGSLKNCAFNFLQHFLQELELFFRGSKLGRVSPHQSNHAAKRGK